MAASGVGSTKFSGMSPAIVAVGGLLACALDCGLISSDIAKISFDLPPKSYRFDTQQAAWNTAGATAFSSVPSVGCQADAACCAPLAAAGVACTSIVCDAPSQTCAFAVTVETPPQPVDLKMESPQLSGRNSQSLADITLSELTFDVTENSLNVNLPVVELFVAPQGVTSTADPAASRLGTVPVIPAGITDTSPGGKGPVPLDPAGQQALVGFAHNFGTPFVFLARSRIVVPGGTPVPSGALSITIGGRLSAKPSL